MSEGGASEIVEAPLVGKVPQGIPGGGQPCQRGELICDIEAMKMENPILSPASGRVKEIKVSPGQVVQAGDPIAVIEY